MVDDILSSTKERCERLQRLLQDGQGPDSVDVQGLRESIRDGFEQILVHGPGATHRHECEQQLWRICFHGPVERFRGLLKRAAARLLQLDASGAPTAETIAEAKIARKDLQAAQVGFKALVDDSCKFYQNLVRRLECLNQSARFSRLSLRGPPLDLTGDVQLCRQLTMCRVWCALGDLQRYRELHADRPHKDWSSARIL
jgi:hypothetical protein